MNNCLNATIPPASLNNLRLDSRHYPRLAFTLVELMVVITVLAVLSSMVLMALAQAQISARKARTQATVTKIHGLIMNKWEEYKIRRVPLDTTGMPPKTAGTYRLNMLRDTMRMEMPDNFLDIMQQDPKTKAIMVVGPLAGGPQPTVLDSYFSLVKPYGNNWPKNLPNYEGARCLYMIVTKLCDDGRDSFNDSEIGAVKNETVPSGATGLPVFLDGWGNPISFLRWPAGFLFPNSDLQSGDPIRDHDPFDTATLDISTTPPIRGYALYPLIYSSGPDGEPGLRTPPDPAFYVPRFDPYKPIASTGPELLGNIDTTTSATNSPTSYLDNIHNHLIGAR